MAAEKVSDQSSTFNSFVFEQERIYARRSGSCSISGMRLSSDVRNDSHPVRFSMTSGVGPGCLEISLYQSGEDL